MDYQLKQIFVLLGKLNNENIIINNIISEMNNIMNENSNNNINNNANLNNTINSLNECMKKVNQNNYNCLNLNTSITSSDRESLYLLNKIPVTFRYLNKEKNFLCDSNTQIKEMIRAYLEETGSLKMPKKPIFLYKGTSLNPNDRRKISEQQGKDLAKSIGGKYYETSALTDLNGNVKTVFVECAKMIMNNIDGDVHGKVKCCMIF